MKLNKPWRLDAVVVLRQTILTGFSQTISMTVGFVLLPIMLARLGPGRYSLLLTLQLFSMSGILAYAEGGLTTGLTRHLVQAYVREDVGEFRAVFATGFLTFIAIGAGCCVMVLLFSQLFFFRVFDIPIADRPEVRIGLWIYALAFLIQFPAWTIRAFYIGAQSLSLLRVWETTERVLYASSIVTLLLFSNSLVHILLVEQGVVVVGLLVLVVVARRRFPQLMTVRLRQASAARLREIWPISSRAFAYKLTLVSYERVPELLIAALLGPAYLTSWAITAKIPRALKGFGSSAGSAAFPAAAALDSLDLKQHLASLALRGARFGYLLVTPLIAFLIVFADEILNLWIGAQYVHLANLLRAFVAWQYMMFLVYYTHSTFTRPEQYGRLVRFSLAANFVFFVILAATIRRYALWGVMTGLLAGGLLTVSAAIRVQLTTITVPARDFFEQVLRVPVVGVGMASLVGLLIARSFWQIHGVTGLVLTGLGLYALYAPLAFQFALRPMERNQVRRLVGLQ